MRDTLKFQFEQNLARVRNLALIYETKLAPAAKGRKPVGSTDILRAAAVFLHAALEELLRGILKWRLPVQNETILNRIPIVGSPNDRPEKFFLGRLVHYRGKTINDVIQDSVDASLLRSNFNSIEEIVSALNSVGLDKTPCEKYFPDIQKLMERRHQIVHRADRNPHSGPGHHEATSIGKYHIEEWSKAADGFFKEVYRQLLDHSNEVAID